LAERGVEIFFTQVFRDSFFHADMHPGNIFVDISDPEKPQYIAIDCGIMGSLTEGDQRYLAENFLAFFNRDYKMVAKLHLESGWIPASTSEAEFEAAIRTVCEPIFGKPLSEISFGSFLVNLFATAREFDMPVQPQLVLLQKTLLYVEGLGRQLYPELDLWQTAKPFLEDWMKDRMSPKRLMEEIKRRAPFWREKLPEIPDLIYKALKSDVRKQQLLEQQVDLLKKQISQQRSHHYKVIYGILGATCLIIAVLTPGTILTGDSQYEWLDMGLTLGGILFLLASLRKA
jgi:ubiquinone biosynthesis protein